MAVLLWAPLSKHYKKRSFRGPDRVQFSLVLKEIECQRDILEPKLLGLSILS